MVEEDGKKDECLCIILNEERSGQPQEGTQNGTEKGGCDDGWMMGFHLYIIIFVIYKME